MQDNLLINPVRQVVEISLTGEKISDLGKMIFESHVHFKTPRVSSNEKLRP